MVDAAFLRVLHQLERFVPDRRHELRRLLRGIHAESEETRLGRGNQDALTVGNADGIDVQHGGKILQAGVIFQDGRVILDDPRKHPRFRNRTGIRVFTKRSVIVAPFSHIHAQVPQTRGDDGARLAFRTERHYIIDDDQKDQERQRHEEEKSCLDNAFHIRSK